jgi:phosphohistidine phosphatase SixA
MREKILLLPILLFSSFAFSQQNEEITRIIIVRHAEKNNDGTKNPSLSAEGKLRAERLNKMLREFKIDKLYATPYARTNETLQPIATERKMEINKYSASDKDFAKNVISNERGKTIVIAGHSNTCPTLVNNLIKEDKYKELDENEYGKLWILTFRNEQPADCILLNY